VRDELHQQQAESRSLAESHRMSLNASYDNLNERVSANSGQLREILTRETKLRLKISSLGSEIGNRSAHNDEQFAALQAELAALKLNCSGSEPEINLGSLELRSPPDIDPLAPPVLPAIEKFSTVLQAIDYLYNLVPTLQSILTSLHSSIMQRSGTPGVSAIESELAGIAAVIPTLATRDELSASLRRPAQFGDGALRSLGIVKCISCGRELSGMDGDDAQHRRPLYASASRSSQRAPIRRKIQTPK
jgi:hypothetical protein